MTEEEIRADERKKVATRVRERIILRWGNEAMMGGTLAQANEVIQDLATDIENNFADWPEDEI